MSRGSETDTGVGKGSPPKPRSSLFPTKEKGRCPPRPFPSQPVQRGYTKSTPHTSSSLRRSRLTRKEVRSSTPRLVYDEGSLSMFFGRIST